MVSNRKKCGWEVKVKQQTGVKQEISMKQKIVLSEENKMKSNQQWKLIVLLCSFVANPHFKTVFGIDKLGE